MSNVSIVDCIFVIFVVDAIGDRILKTYSSIDHVTALHVESNISLYLSLLVEKRTLSMGKVLDWHTSIGFVTALCVESNVSCLPCLIEERTLIMGIVLDAMAVVLLMCLA